MLTDIADQTRNGLLISAASAISFAAYCLNSTAAFSIASTSVPASTPPSHVCLAASLYYRWSSETAVAACEAWASVSDGASTVATASTLLGLSARISRHRRRKFSWGRGEQKILLKSASTAAGYRVTMRARIRVDGRGQGESQSIAPAYAVDRRLFPLLQLGERSLAPVPTPGARQQIHAQANSRTRSACSQRTGARLGFAQVNSPSSPCQR